MLKRKVILPVAVIKYRVECPTCDGKGTVVEDGEVLLCPLCGGERTVDNGQ